MGLLLHTWSIIDPNIVMGHITVYIIACLCIPHTAFLHLMQYAVAKETAIFIGNQTFSRIFMYMLNNSTGQFM